MCLLFIKELLLHGINYACCISFNVKLLVNVNVNVQEQKENLHILSTLIYSYHVLQLRIKVVGLPHNQ
jgi:hypothetical protein